MLEFPKTLDLLKILEILKTLDLLKILEMFEFDPKWGGPPGPRPAPWPASRASARSCDSGTRGSRADRGVRPTCWPPRSDPGIRNESTLGASKGDPHEWKQRNLLVQN